MIPCKGSIDTSMYAVSYTHLDVYKRQDTNNREGFHFWGNRIEVKDLQVFSVESIW